MGDPKFLRRTYDAPKHPWEAARMDEERKLLQKYGLKNKRELWKAQAILRGFRRQARDLQARLRAGEAQAKLETDGLVGRLTRLGLLAPGDTTLDDVLALGIEDILSRRFEWIVVRRGLAGTPNGARQLIVHGHLAIGERRMTRPGYFIPAADEARINYSSTSPVTSDEHPIRVALREKLEARGAEPVAPEGPAPSVG
ncbi:MAG: 30S ribosomal protein S4 [Thermoplasmata archaeon]|nr:30S ribosomal protein S4 [Thermoplasmata archaeon]MCI4359968.1 30S ribosomal protein S4 [Thermoplasmata archaeon]